MKYIKSRIEFLTEAIESINISKTLSFLKSKVKESASEEFLDKLKQVADIFDYPLSKIKDENIKYLSKIQAIKIKPKEDIKNPWGIDCLKFWFSIEDGYLGYTAIGNKTFNYSKKSDRLFEGLRDDEIDFLKMNIPNNLPGGDYRFGELKPIVDNSDYTNLKTGDIVIGYLNSYEDFDYLKWSVIYNQDGKIFAIQNDIDGSMPDGRDWEQYGSYSWMLYSNRGVEVDHLKLHKYIPGDKDLDLYREEENVETTLDEKDENPLDWNLPLKNLKMGNGVMVSWDSNYNSISNEDVLEKADFCLVMYLDDMMDPDKAEFYERPSDIKKSREKSREGATSLMSDEQIKTLNISKYITQLVSRMGISVEKTEFKDLQKLLLKSLCGDFALQSLYSMNCSRLNAFNEMLYDMIEQNTLEDKEYYFKSILETYKKDIKFFNEKLENFKQSDKMILSEEINDFLEEKEKVLFLKQYNKCKQLSKLIQSHIENYRIENLEDLNIAIRKLETLSITIRGDRSFRLTSRLFNILRDFDDIDEVEYHLDRIDYVDLEKNEKILNNLERAINSFLK